MEPFKTHGATLPRQGLTQSAEGCPSGPRPEDLLQGEGEGANLLPGHRVASEAMDNAIAGTSDAPEVTESRLGVDNDNGEGSRGPSMQGNSGFSGGSAPSILTRLEVFRLMTDESKKINGRSARSSDLRKEERVCIILLVLGDKLHSPLSKSQQTLFDKAISLFISKIEKRFKDCKGNMPFFTKKYRDWLEVSFINDLPKEIIKENFVFTMLPGVIGETSRPVLPITPESSSGSRTTQRDYEELGKRQQLRQRRNLQALLEKEPPSKLVKTFTETVSTGHEIINPKSRRDLEMVISECLSSPTRPSKCREKLSSEIKPYTPEEALSMIIDKKLSVETYKFLQQDMKKRGCPMFPPYTKILEARRSCYPRDQINVNEVEASVSLQGLLDHTFKRILTLFDAEINEYCEQKRKHELTCVFEGSWGFDGSTGQSLYKVTASQDPTFDENTIFATTFVPLRIKVRGDQNIFIWMNPNPQSVRFCRPLHIQYRKESQELIKSEKAYVENQILNLSPINTETSKGYNITATCELTLSIIDGKVYNIINNTLSQLRCPICQLTASQFNDLNLAYSKPINEEAVKHGISPLHAYIRCLELLLHLGYKNDPRVRRWRISKSSNEAQITEDRKKRFQSEIRERMGLLVDIVRPNSGTTNDGNTARRVFATNENRRVFSEILEIEKWLVDDISTILVTINSGLPINAESFGYFCKDLAYRYVAEYGWHPMTITLHKILVHGQNIIQASILPVGVLSEQAGESRNKFWRHDREHHTRKDSRMHTMTDLFHRALESSDPVVSHSSLNARRKYKKRIPLPPEVINLLKPLEPPCLDDGDADDDDSDDNDNLENDYTTIVVTEIDD